MRCSGWIGERHCCCKQRCWSCTCRPVNKGGTELTNDRILVREDAGNVDASLGLHLHPLERTAGCGLYDVP